MIDNTRAKTHVVGTMRSEGGTGVVRMEGRYDTDIDDLWSALTDPQHLARWIAEVEGHLRLGGEFQASFTSGWEGQGRVDVCEPPRRLLVTMSPGQGDETVIEAELVADGEQTCLVLEERGLPLGELAAHGAGWQAHVEDLGAHLARRERADWRTRWTELAPSYRDQTGHLA
ncbi:MAG: SRPBCC family protein [Actinomycetes bacterium]